MATVKKLPKALYEALDQIRADLETFIEEQRSDRDERSEKWQEGEAGQAHDAWLDELQSAADALSEIPEEIQ